MKREYKVTFFCLVLTRGIVPLLQMRKLRLRAMKSCAYNFTLPGDKAKVWTQGRTCVSAHTSVLLVFVAQSSISLWPHGLLGSRKPARFLCPSNSPVKNTGVGSHSLFQGIFLTQGLNLGLLHCRQTLCRLSHKGSLLILYNYSSIRNSIPLDPIVPGPVLEKYRWVCTRWVHEVGVDVTC